MLTTIRASQYKYKGGLSKDFSLQDVTKTFAAPS